MLTSNVQNRLQESLVLFDSICNSRWFVKTDMILFLTNGDMFAEKLQRNPLADYFPDYTGGDNYDAAYDYLFQRFALLNHQSATKQIRGHCPHPSDHQQLKLLTHLSVFLGAVTDILLQLHLRECGRL
ncbi:heterotrimeric G protein alpha subunit B [Mycena leptocephala]|nr:heterotrimeric G protein alpha subunit B [Mycena leptocephala]